MKTAVEWLISDLISKGLLTLNGDTLKSIGKAKEMEKEQKKELVIGTYIDLKIKNNKLPYGLEYLNKFAKLEEKAKQYYNEKFTNLSELPISSKQQEQ